MTAAFMIVALLVLAAIPSVLYLSVAKRESPVALAILAGIPLVFVLYVATYVYFQGSEYAELTGMRAWGWMRIMIVPLLVLVAISVLYLSVSKRKSPVTLGFILAGIHLAVVLYVAHSYHGSDFPGLDVLLYLIDMPVSLLFRSVAGFLRLSSQSGGFFFFVYSGVLGSAQYFLWGVILAWAFAHLRENTKHA